MIDFLEKFDFSVFKLINLDLRCDFLDKFFIFISNIDYSYFAVLLALFILILRKKYHIISSILILAAAELNWFIVSFLKNFFQRPRPMELNFPRVNILIECGKGLSFPSGHTIMAFSVATVVALRYPRLRILAFLFALLVGYSRIYVGAHFPFDVVAGAILGIFSSWWIVNLFRKNYAN